LKHKSRIFLYMKYASVRSNAFLPVSLHKHMGETLERVNEPKNGGTMKRRSRLDIIAEILDAAVNGALKTRIMYRANVNFVQFNEYVKCLLEARLMRTIRHERRTIYKTTGKGKLLLRRFNETEEMFNTADGEEADKPLIVKKGPMIYLVKK